MPIRLLVIDCGSPYVADLLQSFNADSEIEVVGRASDLAALVEHTSTAAPDIVLIDDELVPDSQDDYLTEVREHFPSANIFIVTPREELEALRRAQKRPVIGMIAKEAPPQDVVAAMRHAGGNAILLHREFAPGLVQQIRYFRPNSSAKGSPLTPRETEVLTMLSNGTHVDGIARSLRLSVHTVRGHVKNILAKLDSHSQLEAVAKAKARGWVGDPV